MARTTDGPPGGAAVRADDGPREASDTAGSAHHPEIDWIAAERSPEFQELVRRRRSFVVPALAFVFIWYFGFIALAGYAPDFMGESLYEGFTVGYALALSQFVMTWVLGWMYLRRADRVFDPLAHRAAERARAAPGPGDGRPGSRRFDPAEAERVAAERREAERGGEVKH
jgi:uncharacterized membrane protein (DUF485 family)